SSAIFSTSRDFCTSQGISVTTMTQVPRVPSSCTHLARVQEEGTRGTWVIVVTEIPWLVQKSRLVEKIAELLNEKKLPLVADVRDESAEDIRLVIEPRSRTVDPELMMESLFRLTELESRI